MTTLEVIICALLFFNLVIWVGYLLECWRSMWH